MQCPQCPNIETQPWGTLGLSEGLPFGLTKGLSSGARTEASTLNKGQPELWISWRGASKLETLHSRISCDFPLYSGEKDIYLQKPTPRTHTHTRTAFRPGRTGTIHHSTAPHQLKLRILSRITEQLSCNTNRNPCVSPLRPRLCRGQNTERAC